MGRLTTAQGGSTCVAPGSSPPRRRSLLAATTAVLLPAAEAAAPKPKPLAKHLVAPLSAAVDDDGTAYVTAELRGPAQQGAARQEAEDRLRQQERQRGRRRLGLPRQAGASPRRPATPQGNPTKSWVKWITPSGKVRTIANIRAYENKKNPDGKVTYGVRGSRAECAAQWPTEDAGPPSYPGIPDSHPYATMQTDEGTDVRGRRRHERRAGDLAQGQDPDGGRHPAPVPITAELARAWQLPACVVGKTYYGESVPTDVASAATASWS